jgi:hypothetical protein
VLFQNYDKFSKKNKIKTVFSNWNKQSKKAFFNY